ncbi:hypothetical protein [Pseudoalteromonas sp. MMG022]|uniref:hypothetical protein n=1 Tax=Pseudoalteromonas sp. MMG022 TaxID=2909978 RepID=UPI001F28D74A|nr:hypothetical protein [Pseudoalteromonas sp. MMG022]MCF6433899.1 hypothetical protein [Pseudoalteromonas sp. MMG022]
MLNLYLDLSILIGLVVIYEARYILNTASVPINRVAIITSLIEFTWMVISITALFKLPLSAVQVLVPTLYITHNLIGWAYGFILAARQKDDEFKVTIPRWYAIFSYTFGVVFTLLCIVVSYSSL